MWFHWVKSQPMWWLNLEKTHNLSKESKPSNNSISTSVSFRITKSDCCRLFQTVSVAHFWHKIKKSIKILLPLQSKSWQRYLRHFHPFTSLKFTTTSQPKTILPKRSLWDWKIISKPFLNSMRKIMFQTMTVERHRQLSWFLTELLIPWLHC